MLSLIFVVLHLIITTTTSGGSPPYNPINYILHNCGEPSELDFDGRTWKADGNYPECHPANEIDITVTHAAEAVGAEGWPLSVPEVPYRTVHIFVNQCTRSYPVSPGLMFIRLHFYPTNYTVSGFSFRPEGSFFSVTANEYTLLSNFSAFLSASVDNPVVQKEYVVNVNADRLNITFTPSPNSVAFVNGIEIVSIPTGYYIRGEAAGAEDNQIQWVGADNIYYYLFNNTALETLHRLNVGGKAISAVEDTGMDRTGYFDDEYVIGSGYFTPSLDANITYTALLPAYSAPEIVYTTSRTIANYSNVVNWTFPVDSGFLYLFRLYFCEFAIEIDGGNERVFSVDVANKTAESHVDVFLMAGGSKIPIFRDYILDVPAMDGRRNKQNVSFAIRPNMETRPVWANAFLNGLEIFKLNDSQGSMAVPNPERLQISVNQAPPAGRRPGWSKNPKNKRSAPVAAIASGAAGGVAVVVILVFLVNLQRKRATRDSDTNLTRSLTSNPVDDSGPVQSTESCRHFSLDELKSATADFDESYVIGKGGFGKVYRASINESDCSIEDGANSIFAVKRLNKAESRQGENEFWMEIKMLSHLRNQNLVSLIGYCNEEQEMLLVYEFMARGTLADHLYKVVDDDNRPSLSWEQRLNICLGAARGLQYLHAGKVIHRDVKSSNILLDEALVAKISDFGLSKTGPGNDSFTHISTDVKGTFGYLDPEYFLTRRLTTKSDVFAFGVVLFEVLSGRAALDMRLVEEQHSLATWAVECIRKGEIDQMFEHCLVGQMSPACWKVFVEIARRCLHREPRQRPDMADVVKNLELAVALQQRAEVALNVSIIGSDNPSKGWSYLVRSYLYQLFQRGN